MPGQEHDLPTSYQLQKWSYVDSSGRTLAQGCGIQTVCGDAVSVPVGAEFSYTTATMASPPSFQHPSSCSDYVTPIVEGQPDLDGAVTVGEDPPVDLVSYGLVPPFGPGTAAGYTLHFRAKHTGLVRVVLPKEAAKYVPGALELDGPWVQTPGATCADRSTFPASLPDGCQPYVCGSADGGVDGGSDGG